MKVGIFAPPKSGSTFISLALSQLIDAPLEYFQIFRSDGKYLANDVNIEKLGSATDFVWRAHLQASPLVVDLIRSHGIKPIILTRDVSNALVSLRDELLTQFAYCDLSASSEGLFPSFSNINSVESVTKYLVSSDMERMDFIIEYACAWYIAFLQTWRRAASANSDYLWLEFESFVGKEVEALERILKFLGVSIPRDQVTEVVEQIRSEPFRSNISVRFKERTPMAAEQRRRIEDIAERLGYAVRRSEEEERDRLDRARIVQREILDWMQARADAAARKELERRAEIAAKEAAEQRGQV